MSTNKRKPLYRLRYWLRPISIDGKRVAYLTAPLARSDSETYIRAAALKWERECPTWRFQIDDKTAPHGQRVIYTTGGTLA